MLWIEVTGLLLMLAASALVLLVVVESDRPVFRPRRPAALEAAPASPERHAA